MALPQEILRQRTQQDLLRQRQQQLRQKIEQPQPTPEQQATPQEIEEYRRLQQQYEAQQAELQGAISNVDEQISRKAIDLQSIQRSIQEIQDKGGSTPSGMKATANNISEEIARLNARKSILTTSYTIEEARVRQSYYTGQVAERLAPPPIIRTPEQLERLRQTEMRITGVEIAGERVRLPPQQVITPEMAERIRRGEIEPITVKGLVGEAPAVYRIGKEIFFGETGKALVGIGDPGVEFVPGLIAGRPPLVPIIGRIRPTVTGEEISGLLERGGIVGRTAAMFVPETPVEVAAMGAIALAAGAPGIVGVTTRVAMTTIGGYTALQKDLPTEARIAGGIVALAPFAPAVIRGGLRKVKDLPKWGKKGSAQFAELEKFFKKDVGKKSELQKVLDSFSQELNFRRAGNVIRTTTTSEKVTSIRKIFDRIKMTKDPALKRQQIEGIVKMLKAELGDTETGVVLREFLAQEGITATTPQKITEFKIMSGQVQSELQKITVVPSSLVSEISEEKSLFFVTEKEAVVMAEKERLALAMKFGVTQALAPRQLFFQPQLLAQVPRLAMPSLFGWPTPTIAKPRVRIKVRPKVPIPKIPRLSEASIKKVEKALKELRGKSVNVLVGMEKKKQKIIYKNLPPRKAYMKAQQFVDKNIQASFKIVPTGKKTKKKDIKEITFSGKFRPSKREPLYQVEKRKYRLDMPTEKKQIKRAKQRKKK